MKGYYNFPAINRKTYDVQVFELNHVDEWAFVGQVPNPTTGGYYFKRRVDANKAMALQCQTDRDNGKNNLRYNVVEHITGCTNYLYITNNGLTTQNLVDTFKL